MLIAGTAEDVWYPAGFERVHGVHFEPKATDKSIFFRTPPGWNGPTLDAVKAVKAQGAKIELITTYGCEVLLNWGTGGPNFYNTQTLNRWAAVQRSSNQTESLKALGDLAPRSFDSYQDLVTGSIVVGKKNHGSHGRGKRVFEVTGVKRDYPVYQQFIRNRTEWRVHVFKGKTISVLRKERLNNEPPENLRPEFKFSRVNVIPTAVSWMAQEAAKRVGLDFAGVDIIRNDDTEQFFVLETNSAPGMSPVTIRRLYMHIQHEFSV